jgi:hypothetical protein
VIKGTFKDHFVTWVNDYLLEVHGEAHGLEIIADIDHRYLTFIAMTYMNLSLAMSAFQPCLHFQAYAAFLMGAISRSGPATTQKH